MLMDVAQFSLTLLTFAAMMILNYSMFKIPIRENHQQITILTLLVGTVNYYLKFILESSLFFPIQLLLTMILLTILRKYPLMYSFIVSVIGAIVFSFIDGIVSFGAIILHLTTYQRVLTNIIDYSVIHILVTLTYILISFVLIKYKIGFSFIVRRFSGKYIFLKTSTFIWGGLLSIGILILQIGAKQFGLWSFHFVVMILLTLILLASIYYAYLENKKILAVRYGEEYLKKGVEKKKNEF